MAVRVIESTDNQGFRLFIMVCDAGHDFSINPMEQEIKSIKFCPSCAAKVTVYEHADGYVEIVT